MKAVNILVLVCFIVFNPEAANTEGDHNRQKRSGIADQHLAELEAMIAMQRPKSFARVPVAWGVIDPQYIGRRKKRSAQYYQKHAFEDANPQEMDVSPQYLDIIDAEKRDIGDTEGHGVFVDAEKRIIDAEKRGIIDAEKRIVDAMKRGIIDAEKRGIIDAEKREVLDAIKRGIVDGEKRGISNTRKGKIVDVEKRIIDAMRRRIVDAEKRGIIDAEKRIVDAEKRGIIDAEKRGIIDAEKRGIIDAEKRGIIDAEKRGIIDAEKRIVDAEKRGIIDAEKRGIIDAEKRIVDAEKRGIIDAEKRGIIDAEKRGIIDAEKRIVDAEKRGIIDAEKRGIIDAEKRGIIDAEKRGIIDAEKRALENRNGFLKLDRFEPNLFAFRNYKGVGSFELPSKRALIDRSYNVGKPYWHSSLPGQGANKENAYSRSFSYHIPGGAVSHAYSLAANPDLDEIILTERLHGEENS